MSKKINKKEESKKESLGYLFGYKETKQTEENQFTVKFIHGVSKSFPSKYKNKKDFYAEEFFVGDTSELFINIDALKFYVMNELINIKEDAAYYDEMYEKSKYSFITEMPKEMFLELQAFSYGMINFMYQTFESDAKKASALKMSCPSFEKLTDEEALKKYAEYNISASNAYDDDIERALVTTTKKPKP